MMSSRVMMPMGLAAPSSGTPRFRDSRVMAGEELQGEEGKSGRHAHIYGCVGWEKGKNNKSWMCETARMRTTEIHQHKRGGDDQLT